ncbi:hypothetical protein [Arthrobacter sp. ISL-28]|uniref:hypothetical protein n=1 Tax=Arthrobacter sp. ISL-28 TaxID=2819108 RepID=UPI0020363790|nr:hypothetical protein [Arthrobacter sp. ISL-28]
METNGGGELVVTIVRKENVNPRIRYDIHDRGHVLRMRHLNAVLKEFGSNASFNNAILTSPDTRPAHGCLLSAAHRPLQV